MPFRGRVERPFGPTIVFVILTRPKRGWSLSRQHSLRTLFEKPRIVLEWFSRMHPDLCKVRMPGINQPVRFSRSQCRRNDENGRTLVTNELIADLSEFS